MFLLILGILLSLGLICSLVFRVMFGIFTVLLTIATILTWILFLAL
jgi:hypothetical protein